MTRLWLLPGVLIVAVSGLAGKTEGEPSSVRNAVTRGYAAIQAAQKVSHTSQTCTTTCHLQVYGAFAYRAVRSHQIAVDDAIARPDLLRAFRRFATNFNSAIEDTGLGEVGINEAFFLVAAHDIGLRASVVTAALARTVALQQNHDGDWSAFYDRPPSSHSSFTFTALGLRAIQLYGHPNVKPDTDARVARARQWLQAHAAPDTEDRTYQLLGLLWAGADASVLKPLAMELAAHQRADGGWNSLAGRESDAYSTGEALVALHDAGGVPITDLVWRRGVDFLLRTQKPDGTWHVTTRLPPWVNPPYFESGYPYGRDQFISVAGANWSVRALSLALGAPTEPDRLPLADVTPPDLEPWVETATFGTAADLERLLDGGLSPNAATAAGHTTLLMLVVPDMDKVRLLLERGADVHRLSARNYSALLVASQYPDASAAMRLLLDRGADIGAPKTGGKPAADAYPTFFASHAGNAEMLPTLHKRGDSLDRPTIMFGVFPITPLSLAASWGRLDVMRTLLDLGAKVDAPKSNVDSPLEGAVMGHRVEAARLLIARGADVNWPGEEGRTPLIYAAVADFGSPAMLELLLTSGARVDARDDAGLTATDYARKYHHADVARRLEANSVR